MTLAPAIELRSVSKSYGSADVLTDISFSCPSGSIVAFVGPNGAGKSTTLRILCRLTTANSGEVSVLGSPLSELADPGLAIGSVLDPTAHHPGRTVWSTVRVPALMLGIPSSRVGQIIEQLGLGSVKRRRFSQLSLGMKQRVSLAIALLAQPRILVLDEPMNGLDVDGIEWMRALLRQYVDGGGTVLISSHLLNELQMFADHLVIISQGRIVADKPLNRGRTESCTVEPADPDAFERVLVAKDVAFERSANAFTVAADRDTVARLAFDSGVLLLGIARASSERTIEQTYHDLTEGEFAMKLEGFGNE